MTRFNVHEALAWMRSQRSNARDHGRTEESDTIADAIEAIERELCRREALVYVDEELVTMVATEYEDEPEHTNEQVAEEMKARLEDGAGVKYHYGLRVAHISHNVAPGVRRKFVVDVVLPPDQAKTLRGYLEQLATEEVGAAKASECSHEFFDYKCSCEEVENRLCKHCFTSEDVAEMQKCIDKANQRASEHANADVKHAVQSHELMVKLGVQIGALQSELKSAETDVRTRATKVLADLHREVDESTDLDDQQRESMQGILEEAHKRMGEHWETYAPPARWEDAANHVWMHYGKKS